MMPLTTVLYNVARLLHIATTSSCKCREIPYPSEIPIIQWFNKTMPFHALSSYSAISSYSSRRPMFLAAAEFFAQPEEHWKTSHVLWQQTCSNKAKKIKSAAMLRFFNECSHVFSCSFMQLHAEQNCTRKPQESGLIRISDSCNLMKGLDQTCILWVNSIVRSI